MVNDDLNKAFRDWKDGDTSAFKKLYEALHDILLPIAGKIVKRFDYSQDVVCKVFEELIRTYTNKIEKIRKIEDYEHLKKRLIVSVKNRSIDLLRKEGRIVLDEDIQYVIEQTKKQHPEAEDKIAWDALDYLIKEKLGEDCFRVWELYKSGKTTKEVMAIVGKSQAWVLAKKAAIIKLIKESRK